MVRHDVFSIVLGLFFFVGGCFNKALNSLTGNVRYDKSQDVTSPLASGSNLEAETYNGFIKIIGFEKQECHVSAVIHAYAPTETEAKEIAEKTNVRLEVSGKTLLVKLDKPELKSNRSVVADYTIHVPRRTNINVKTYNGPIDIDRITEKMNAKTYNGAIQGRDVSGEMNCESYNGNIRITYSADSAPQKCSLVSYNSRIHCEGIKGDLKSKTYNGAIDVVYAKDAPGNCQVCMEAYNGNLSLTPPRSLSARVEASTQTGSISSRLPIVVTGMVHKRLEGTIGAGQGQVTLTTHNGSITVR